MNTLPDRWDTTVATLVLMGAKKGMSCPWAIFTDKIGFNIYMHRTHADEWFIKVLYFPFPASNNEELVEFSDPNKMLAMIQEKLIESKGWVKA